MEVGSYSYDEALSLPSWLFWHLADASALQIAEMQQRTAEAIALGMGSMKKESIKSLEEQWKASRERVIPELIRPSALDELEKALRESRELPKMTPERMDAWLNFGSG